VTNRKSLTMPAIRVANLQKSFKNLEAVHDVSFDVERGEVFALLGPNGAGKTTCIEILEGFLRRDSGEVQVLGVDPGSRQDQQWLRMRIGVVLQELAVESFFTVRQVLARNAGFYPAPRPIDEVIELVGLGEKADARVKRLSGGQQRRLDIGLGIIGRPELLFLDEPTTGLDPGARRTTWELIRTLAGEGTTVLLSSHYMDEVEALAKSVAVLRRGSVVASGPPASLGGRDRGQVTIRFTLPAGVAHSDLPVAPTRSNGTSIEIITTDEITVLNQITGWALQRKEALMGLDVTRTTLEDVYIALTHEESHEPEGATHD
jgi:ABC-2 type transport system ATP-binding protein